MPRIAYVPLEGPDVPPALRAALTSLAEQGIPIENHHRALANRPQGMLAFLTMSRYVRVDSAVPSALRELAILATAVALDSAYEWASHRPLALAAGLSEAKVQALADGRVAGAPFSALEEAVTRCAVQMAVGRDVDDATYEALRRELGEECVFDLVLTIGWYHLCAAVLGALHVSADGS